MRTLPCPVPAARSLLIFCSLLFAGIDVACAGPQPQETSRPDGDWLSDIFRIMRGASDYDSLLAQKWMHEWIGEPYRVHNSAAAQSSREKLWPVIISNVEPGTIRQQALTDYALPGPLDQRAVLVFLLTPQEDQRIRKSAGTALWCCDFQDPVLAGPLTAALQSPEPLVQESVIRAIRSLRGNTKAAIPEIKRIFLNEDAPENVRIEAAETIRNMVPAEAARPGIAVPPDE